VGRSVRLIAQIARRPGSARPCGRPSACYAAGMNDFIAKPANPEVFIETLLRWLSRD
jgi:CheY-like chemotaxis protein